MLNEPTIEKLRALGLEGMCSAWCEQQAAASSSALAFDERLAMLVDAEWAYRDNRRFRRAIKEAKLRYTQACIEAIDYPAKRELDKAIVRQLASGRWIKEHQAIVITGATGSGKSFLACAFAHQACRQGHRAVYRRASRLFHELKVARADGSYQRVLARFAKIDVLVIDDFAIAPVNDHERHDLLEILEDRQETRSTIITSQLEPKHWHDYLADPTVADAICDRVLSRAHRLVLKGPSRRKDEPKT